MAWIDDRIWCHSKFVNLSDGAFAAYVKAVALSSGMATGGHLEIGHQRLLGVAPKAKAELITAGLWELNGDGKAIDIHDWDDHNSKRDEKRAKDRERKRRWREGHKGDEQ